MLYCFNFMKYEAVRLASFDRYVSIYFLMLLYILIVILINKNIKISLVFLIFCLILPYKQIDEYRHAVGLSINARYSYEINADEVKKLINKDDKIYFVSQNTTGLDYYTMKYVLRPNIVNEIFSWSIGSRYNDGDIWTKEINSNEWMNLLITNQYDYVYLYNVDEKFIDEFGNLFESNNVISNLSLYAVDIKNKKLLKKN